MPSTGGDRRAVVIGAGLAGLAAAAAIQSRDWEVVLVERDRLEAGPSLRRGVPQAGQLHNVLGRAQRELETLLPGFVEALVDAGAGRANVAAGTHVYELGAVMPRRDLGLELLCAPRSTIDDVARRLLQQRDAVDLIDGRRVTELLVSDGRAAGVALDGRSSPASVSAPLVVDASGGSSPALRWLEGAGFVAPPVETRTVHQWYVSSVYTRPAELVGGEVAWMVFPTQGCPRGVLVSPLSEAEWCVSVTGRDPEPPPASHEGILAHVASLPDPTVRSLLDAARPAGLPTLFRRPAAIWRHYELVEDPLPGFLPLGDAVAALNPVFGQGMSVAAWQATGLAAVLELWTEVEDVTRAHHDQAAVRAGAAWRLAELAEGPVEDLLAEVAPSCPTVEGLVRSLADDEALHRRYVAMWHLLEPAGGASVP